MRHVRQVVINVKNWVCAGGFLNSLRHRPGRFNLILAALIAISACGQTSARAVTQNTYSIYDGEVPEVYSRQFFSYFHFRPYGYRVTRDGFIEISYKLPHSNHFRSFINLYVKLNESGHIKQSTLVMQRRFVDDKVRGAFARDYAKSFVQAAVPEQDLDAVRPLYNEIFFRQEIKKIPNVKIRSDSKGGPAEATAVFKLGAGKLKAGDIIIFGPGGELPKLPSKPSALYRCFAGERKSGQLKLSFMVLKFSNEKVEGEQSLVISVVPVDDDDSGKKLDIDFSRLPLRIPVNL